MTFYEPLTAFEIEQRITECIRDLESATEDYRGLCRDAGRAEIRHKAVRAAALKTSSGTTVEQREADAELTATGEFQQRKDAESAAAVGKEVLYSLRSILTAYQSLLAMVRNQT